MPEIKAILLVPEKGDPHGLLKEGPCGARPPTSYVGGESVLRCPRCRAEFAGAEGKSYLHGVLCSVCKGPVRGVCHPTGECVGGKQALVLALDGKPVREGCYRAADALEIAPSAVPGAIECALDGDQMIRSISELGTIVLLDTEGKETA